MYFVSALYHFTYFADPEQMRPQLLALCQQHKIKGTLLLAHEGINGTIAGSEEGIKNILEYIRSLPDCANLECKCSTAREMPFVRMKVRIKKEIVTMGQPNIDPRKTVGKYVPVQDWDTLCAQRDVVVIDTRNQYECAIGTFAGAVNPNTQAFREFPDWWQKNAERFAGKKVAMFCTGGIRCEKASAYLLQEGVEQVYHLQGGILKYLEHIPPSESRWQGECFVFDQRVAVGHGVEEGDHFLCRGCRTPLLPEDIKRPEFEMGVSCHHCLGNTTERQRAGFRERHRQILLKEQS